MQPTKSHMPIHHGRNVKRFREMLGLKQEGLAYELGEEWTQKRVSLLEQKEVIEQELLEQIAQVLKVPAEAIKNFDEETAIYNIQHNYEGSNNQGAIIGHQVNFNPLDKLIEVMDENKKLYERLLESEKEKVALLREVLKGHD
ncbi:transcriptional regulator [Siphonobacter curvatus]|uniref:Transcriptional regulator n=2 Tax=Siphonobacter curvatus TaxID=2094562 RepID=A0A2S7IHC0_9BACT|nr:transcriptional regulator [Siphonobacter curvatus]